MEWHQFVEKLLNDKVILSDKFKESLIIQKSLNGLLGMDELRISIPEKLIVDVVNSSIKLRNEYSDEVKKLKYLALNNGEIVIEFDKIAYDLEKLLNKKVIYNSEYNRDKFEILDGRSSDVVKVKEELSNIGISVTGAYPKYVHNNVLMVVGVE